MTSFLEGLRAWRALNHRKEQPEDPETHAGALAENFLKRLIDSNLKFNNGYAFPGKRIPSHIYGNRYEVDLIVLTPKYIHVIEVKNWSGTLQLQDGQWVQTRRNGQEIQHASLSSLNQEKKEALIAYLHNRSIPVNPSQVTQKIIFMNNNLRILSPEIRKDPHIIQAYELKHYLDSQWKSASDEKIVQSIIEVLLAKEKQEKAFSRSVQGKYFYETLFLLRSLETWDRLRLHGGKTLVGDGLQLITHRRSFDLKKLPSGTKYPVSWSQPSPLLYLLCLLGKSTVGSINLPNRKIAISPHDMIKFHQAMATKPSVIPLGEVDLFIRG